MNYRFGVAILVVALALSWLIYSAVQASAKSVVTVNTLFEADRAEQAVRLGARVADADINYKTSPEFLLSFSVIDPEGGKHIIPVEFKGMKPDTFQIGRDVILEGDYNGKTFYADTLLTQCPSKYEAPVLTEGTNG